MSPERSHQTSFTVIRIKKRIMDTQSQNILNPSYNMN